MNDYPRSVLTGLPPFAAVVLAAALVARAQTPAPAAAVKTPVYVVVFVDLDPRYTDQGLPLLRAYGEASRRAPGAQRFGVLCEIARPNHFTFLEV